MATEIVMISTGMERVGVIRSHPEYWHVHKPNCAHLGRYSKFTRQDALTYLADSMVDLVIDTHAGQIMDAGPEDADEAISEAWRLLEDFWFAPCVNLPVGTPTPDMVAGLHS